VLCALLRPAGATTTPGRLRLVTKRRLTKRKAATATLVLPLELTRYTGGNADDWRAFYRAQRDWFRAHGIDFMRDFATARAVQLDSYRAHGIPLPRCDCRATTPAWCWPTAPRISLACQ
jgi:hypothetical protein